MTIKRKTINLVRTLAPRMVDERVTFPPAISCLIADPPCYGYDKASRGRRRSNGIKFFLIGGTASFLISATSLVFAAGNIDNPIGATTFTQVILGIVNFMRTVFLPFAVIIILYAGFLFMTSAGDTKKVEKARHALVWALVGIAIIIIGPVFIDLIANILKGGG